MKKFLIILISVFVVAGLAAGAYLLFSKKSSQTSTSSTSQPTFSTPTKVSNDDIYSPVVTFDRSGVWYFDSQGALYRRDLTQDAVTEFSFNSAVPAGFKQAIWPPVGNDFIFIGNGKSLFAYSGNQFKPLPANIQNLDFMPDGKRMAYIWKAGDNKTQTLFVANSDATAFNKVADVFWPDLTVKVSPDGRFALLIRSNIQTVNKIYRADLASGKVDTVVGLGENVDAKWISPTKFLYVSIMNNKYEVNMFDFGSNKSMDLGIAATLDRVVADPAGKFIYSDVKDGDSNTIIKTDLDSLQSQNIYHMDPAITPKNLMLANGLILFVNSQDNKLYELSQ